MQHLPKQTTRDKPRPTSQSIYYILNPPLLQAPPSLDPLPTKPLQGIIGTFVEDTPTTQEPRARGPDPGKSHPMHRGRKRADSTTPFPQRVI
jgi:hypothetical protein